MHWPKLGLMTGATGRKRIFLRHIELNRRISQPTFASKQGLSNQEEDFWEQQEMELI